MLVHTKGGGGTKKIQRHPVMHKEATIRGEIKNKLCLLINEISSLCGISLMGRRCVCHIIF